MYILYQNFLKKSIKFRKTQFEYLILHQEHGLEYAAAGVCSLSEIKGSITPWLPHSQYKRALQPKLQDPL